MPEQIAVMGRRLAKWLTALALAAGLAWGSVAAVEVPACRLDANELPKTLGVVRMNLYRIDSWQQVIDSMADSDVKAARFALKGDFDKSFETVKYARAKGIDVLVEVSLVQPELQLPTEHPRSGGGNLKDQYGLSGLDLAHYESVIRRFVEQLDNAGVTVTALEVGNETNWADFNGDLPILDRGIVFRDMDELGTARSGFVTGMNKYAEAVRITRRVLDESKLQKNVKLISAGLVAKNTQDDMGRWYVQSGGTVVAVELMNRIYDQMGISRLFDGRGIHIYPKVNVNRFDENEACDEIQATVAAAAEACSPVGEPCYVTEWGFNSDHDGCDGSDPRMPLFTDFLSALSRHKNITAAYLFTWDDGKVQKGKQKKIWRCGKASPVVKVLSGK